MPLKQVVPGVYGLAIGGYVNCFVLDVGGAVTLIDTGTPGHADGILSEIARLGRQPTDVKHILVTHAHPDHTGSLAALQRATGAPVYMHAADAALVRAGQGRRTLVPVPGPLAGLMRVVMRGMRGGAIEPAVIAHEVADGDELPMAGGLKVYHAPGHSAGQVVFLWPQQGGVLFAADAAANLFGRLGYAPVCEDFDVVLGSLNRLAALDFNVAVFGHGGPLLSHAAARFREKWRH